MPTDAPDGGIADMVDAVAELLDSVPAEQRPAGFEELTALLGRVGAHAARSADAPPLAARLGPARETLEGLLAELSEVRHEASDADLDPAEALDRVQALSAAWERRDGAAVDRLVAELDGLSTTDRAERAERAARIDQAVAGSIAASMRRAGLTPSSER